LASLDAVFHASATVGGPVRQLDIDIDKALDTVGVEAPQWVWLAVHAYLCLGLRHPMPGGAAREATVSFVNQLAAKLVEAGIVSQDVMDRANYYEQEQQGRA
jgi:hypothetical protein